MKIIRPESEKKEVPLVSGGVYTDENGELRIVFERWGFKGYWVVTHLVESFFGSELADNESILKHRVQSWTYHPNAELVLEPKR